LRALKDINYGKEVFLMNLIKDKLAACLQESAIIDYKHPLIQGKVLEFKKMARLTKARAEIAFHFVRDEIQHAFDHPGTNITITASETLVKKEGICFAKAHLYAALLRAMDIPAGFCYQKVTRKGTIESGYALHGLNAVYIDNRWHRLDPRGNKPGISSTFSLIEEDLAYPIHTELGEEDYHFIFAEPLDEVIQSMKESKTYGELFFRRPEQLDAKVWK
jgi:hypothetical protein